MWGRITLPVFHSSWGHAPVPEGMKFTLVVFSCKQYGDVVAARSSHSTRTVYNVALEPGTGYRTQRNRRLCMWSKEFCAW